MSDLRYDPLFDLWVAIAENRRDRPIEFVPIEQSFKQLICPFCGGNEEETPPELLRLGPEDKSVDPTGLQWHTRVIPNKFPTYFGSQEEGVDCGPYQHSYLSGDQELIIPTPRHVFSFSDLTIEEFVLGLQAAQIRMQKKESESHIKHAMLFGNCRSEAGASVAHVHFQLIGSPLVSPMMASRMTRLENFRHENGVSMTTAMLNHELKQHVRIVAETDDLVMLCPYASRFAFQIWLMPRNDTVAFSKLDQNQLQQLCELSQRYLRRVEVLLSEPAYNWLLHQPPMGGNENHWFVEIIPRVAKTAGYEMGTDIWINPVAPEVAARRLRT